MIAAAVPTGTDPTKRLPAAEPAPVERGRFERWSYNWVSVVVVVGLLCTAALAIVSAQMASSNEQHLLRLRSKEVASALTSALPDIETPLGAVVALADTTDAGPAKLKQFAAPYVGTGPGHLFTSISIWRIGHLNAGPVVVIGTNPELPSAKGGALAVLRAATQRSGLTVRGLLHAAHPRIAYAYAGSQPGAFIVEAEQALAASRYTRLPANSAYSNVDVAVYIAKHPRPSRLLLSTVRKLPLPGEHATAAVPFGSETLTVVVSARQPLGGSLPEVLPWLITVLGLLLTAAAAALTARLISGRRQALVLAAENRDLYAEQRGIALTLQHALLPDALPEISGIQLAALYDAGVPGIDVGGDWYDVISLDDDRLLLVVGDVSGRGIKAATAMASLRVAIQYAARADPPEVFLPRLSNMGSLRENQQLATILCVVIELSARRLSVTSAGHLPPLIVHDGQGEFLSPKVGLPVGVDAGSTYTPSSFTVPPGATLLAFTDGLVERHDESLDVGLERLSRAAASANGELQQVLAMILEQVRGSDSVDDTAMAGIRWLT